MMAATRDTARSVASTRPGRIQHTRRKVGQGTGRAVQPQARPPRPVRNPPLRSDPAVPALGCRVPRPALASTVGSPTALSTWRLTDRGIALIVATGLAIAIAALVVVGLTAIRVTADNYVPHGPSQVLR